MMGWREWFRSKRGAGDNATVEWRRQWQAACASPEAAQPGQLREALQNLGLTEDDIEMEREMLAGLEQLIALRASVAAEGLPTIETGHRVAKGEPCHFSAAVSMPDDETQPSGRLIFTSTRAIFAGGAKASGIPWHAIAEVLQQDRDLVLVRNDRETFYRYRCNLFADALAAAFLARTLATRRRGV